MKLKMLVGSLTLVFVNSVMALPNLSEPNDIFPVYENIVEILNSNDSSILECNLVEGKLEACESKSVNGLVSPFRGAAAVGYLRSQVVYVAEKGINGLYSFQTDKDGHIASNTTAIRLPTYPYDDDKGGSILEIRRSGFYNNEGFYTQRFFISRSPSDSSSGYGQFISLMLGAEQAKVSNSAEYSGVYLPAFSVEQGEAAHSQNIIGAGQNDGVSSSTSDRYPFSGTIRENNGQFKSSQNSGGAANKVKTILDSDVASIAQVNGKYWVTYKSQKKFTRFDDFPNSKAIDSSSYDAPDNGNVELRTVKTRLNNKDEVNSFAVFANDNKVGICTGDSDFECEDAFRYLEVFAAKNDAAYMTATSLTSTDLADHGEVVFRNLNYSPINSDEVTLQMVIPDDLKGAFSGSCLNKTAFDKRSAQGSVDGSDTCKLDYDFRLLTNAPPINESFDVGFIVHGAFGDVPTMFTFNIALPTSIPHLQFENNGTVLNQLNLNAGDTGSIDIVYVSNQSQSMTPNIRFLNGIDNSSLFRSYFTDTGCLASPPPQLSAGKKCTLSFHIPAKVNSVNYTISLNNPAGVPADDGVLPVELSSKGNVILHLPSGNQNIEHISSLHELSIHSGGNQTVRFTNVGSATAHSFNVNFIQPQQQHIPILLEGSCKNDPAPDLSALGGSCDLVIKLNSSASSVSGRFTLHVAGDDIDSYDIPLTINEFPHDKGLSIVDSNTPSLSNIEMSQMSNGFLTLTNYTGYQLSDLKITLPFISGQVFYYNENNDKSSNCLANDTPTRVIDTSLAPLESCKLYYHVASSYTANKQDVNINFRYTDNNTSVENHEQAPIHFTNQPAIRLSESNLETGLKTVELDASIPQQVVVFTNELSYTVENFTLGVDKVLSSITSKNDCQNKPLGTGESCSITFTLNDFSPLIGKYQLLLKADNLEDNSVPLNINMAQTDTVEIDNNGVYLLSVDSTAYYPNSNGTDGHCKSGPCYSTQSTGWYTNPNHSAITGVSGRDITMYMMAGSSESLPSCDKGKISCTGSTLIHSCQYYADDTGNPATAQNQCLKYNKR
ncbi:MAG: hypothetical protein ACPGUD_09940 [Parashewanella sp.]